MIRMVTVISVLLFVAGAGYAAYRMLSPQAGVLPLRPTEFIAGQVVVKFRDDADTAALATLRAQMRIIEIDKIPALRLSLLDVPPGSSVGEVVATLSRDPNVEFAEPNYVGTVAETPNDPDFSSRQWTLKMIHTAEAWDISTRSASITVALIDSGVEYGHPDLQSKIVKGHNYIENSDDPRDGLGHGTAVAGIIGAITDNGTGTAGPIRLDPILVLRNADASGQFSSFMLAHAIADAVDQDAKVVNLSEALTVNSRAVATAVDYAWDRGVVLVAAAGNDGREGIAYPAALPHVVAVGAVDESGARWTGSNYGPQMGVVAPGVGVWSTALGGGYGSSSGTSLATAHVSGLAALIWSANPLLTNQQVVDIIEKTADDIGKTGGKQDAKYGYGRINALKALEAATSS